MNYMPSLHLILLLLIFKIGNSQKIDFFTSDRLILGILKERTTSIDVGVIDNDGDENLLDANGRY